MILNVSPFVESDKMAIGLLNARFRVRTPSTTHHSTKQGGTLKEVDPKSPFDL
jgi:hypothetical protein